MISITVTLEHEQIQQLKLLTEEEKRAGMYAVISQYLEWQNRRLKDGKTVDGDRFAPYTNQYTVNKHRAGRMEYDYWLRLTGQMMRQQKETVRMKGNSIVGKVYFSGMHSPTKFSNPRRKKQWNKTERSQRAGLRSQWRKETRRQISESAAYEPLTVSKTGGKKTATSLIAEANDRRRPFIGVTEAQMDQLIDIFISYLGRD